MNRPVLLSTLAAMLILGFLGWAHGMPRPAPLVTVTAPLEPTPTPSASADAVAPASAPTALPAIDAAWLDDMSVRTGIPRRVLAAYAGAAIVQEQADPACGLTWNVLAAIGAEESGHGTIGGASIDDAGRTVGAILGPPLDGGEYDAVADTDAGALDGDTTWDRAVGPMQFIPSTWADWGRDANGDGAAEPTQIDDAAASAAAYLCAAPGGLATGEGWARAIATYNSSPEYAERVRARADGFAAAVA